VRSVDAARDRRAPRRYVGRSLSGESVEGEFVGLTLIVAVKEDCLGCRSVLESPSDAFGDAAVLIVAGHASCEPWWAASLHLVVISPSLLEDLDVRWPPFYVLVDPTTERVVTEGVVFGPEQVLQEIAPYLV
jgi:hypothetical protein